MVDGRGVESIAAVSAEGKHRAGASVRIRVRRRGGTAVDALTRFATWEGRTEIDALTGVATGRARVREQADRRPHGRRYGEGLVG